MNIFSISASFLLFCVSVTTCSGQFRTPRHDIEAAFFPIAWSYYGKPAQSVRYLTPSVNIAYQYHVAPSLPIRLGISQTVGLALPKAPFSGASYFTNVELGAGLTGYRTAMSWFQNTTFDFALQKGWGQLWAEKARQNGIRLGMGRAHYPAQKDYYFGYRIYLSNNNIKYHHTTTSVHSFTVSAGLMLGWSAF